MNTDSNGNKLPEPKISETVKSTNIRQRRINATVQPGSLIRTNIESKFCSECGFRKRTANHEQGRHHKDAVR